MKKGFEKIWIPFGTISNSETLCNSMIFMREDKMTSSKHMKYELEVSKKSNLKSLWNYFSIWSYLGFIQIIFLQIQNILEIRVKWFPTLENWR